MWVALVPQGSDASSEDDIISGRIARYSGVETEVFSALLSPTLSPPYQKLPGGGTAIISVSAFNHADSLHINIVFNGIYTKAMEATGNVTLNVQLNPVRGAEQVTDKVFLEKIYVVSYL